MAHNIGEVDHPLVTRAWPVQERALPRRTLHFGKHQMYFECNEGFRGENGLHIPWRYHSIHSIIKRDQHGPMSNEDRNAALALWYSLLWNYGDRRLTEASDKLPAISGIARLLAERLDDEYMAGLWRKSLIEELLWQGLKVRRLPQYRAPSWSWASVDGIPAMNRGNLEPLAKILDCKVELKGKNIFGEVKSGWIKIQAPLVPLILDERVDPEGTGIPYDNNPKVKTEKGNPEGCYSRFDFPFSEPTGREEALAMVESLKGVEIFALILAKELLEVEDDVISYCSLIVCQAERDNGAMQRLGFINLSTEVLGECNQLDHPEEWPIINLV